MESRSGSRQASCVLADDIRLILSVAGLSYDNHWSSNSPARGNVGWSRVLRSDKHGMTCLMKYGFGTTMTRTRSQAWTQVIFKSACIVPGTSPERFLNRKVLVRCYEWPSAYSSDFEACATYNQAGACASIVDNWTPVTDLSTCDPHGFAMA